MKTGFENLNHQARARLKNMAAPNGWRLERDLGRVIEVRAEMRSSSRCSFCREDIGKALNLHWCEPLEIALKNVVTNGVVGDKVPGIVTPEQFEAFDLATLAAVIDAHFNGEFDE
jgi:hypothetical protein